MVLFDGLSLGADKLSVVFEFGSAFTRCGFAHEYSPRAIIRTQSLNGINFDTITDVDDFKIKMREFVEDIYFRFLAVNPKDRKVVIVNSLFQEGHFQKSLAEVFYKHFDVPGIIFLPGHLMSMMTVRADTALVVDFGKRDIVAVPVVDGVTMMDSLRANSFGGAFVDQCMAMDVIKYEGRKVEFVKSSQDSSSTADDEDLIRKVFHSVAEDVRVKSCFVPRLEKGKRIQQRNGGGDSALISPPDFLYPVDSERTFMIPGFIRDSAYECLFEPDQFEDTLPSLILDAINSTPIDCRKVLRNNILLIGGGASIPGLKLRLYEELKDREAGYSFGILPLPCPSNYASWLGSAIYASTDAVSNRIITKDAFLKNPVTTMAQWNHVF